jgi:hypothetical protein
VANAAATGGMQKHNAVLIQIAPAARGVTAMLSQVVVLKYTKITNAIL